MVESVMVFLPDGKGSAILIQFHSIGILVSPVTFPVAIPVAVPAVAVPAFTIPAAAVIPAAVSHFLFPQVILHLPDSVKNVPGSVLKVLELSPSVILHESPPDFVLLPDVKFTISVPVGLIPHFTCFPLVSSQLHCEISE